MGGGTPEVAECVRASPPRWASLHQFSMPSVSHPRVVFQRFSMR